MVAEDEFDEDECGEENEDEFESEDENEGEDEELEQIEEENEEICKNATPDNCPTEICGDECELEEEEIYEEWIEEDE